MTQKPPVPPYLAIFFGILAVSTAAIFIRFAQEDVPSLVVAAYRLSISTLILIPFAWRRRSELRSLQRRDLLATGLAGSFLALHFATWISSLELTSVASSVVLVTTTPLWVALFSPLILKEALSRRAGLGMIIALAGGVIVGVSDSCLHEAGGFACPPLQELMGGNAFTGNFLALSGAWMAAGYLIVGRRVRSKLSLVTYISLVYGSAAVILVSMAIAGGYQLGGYPAQAFMWLAMLAIFPQLVGHSIFNWALAYMPASYVAVTLLGEPVGSTILAYFLLAETPTGGKLLGGLLILTGIALATWTNNNQHT
jgi:drug/metabolite transporter (DMT)-like permease